MIAFDANEFAPMVDTPISLASRMARYCRDISTIRAACCNSFGRAPTDSHIANLVKNAQRRSQFRRNSRQWTDDFEETEVDMQAANTAMRVALQLDWPCGHQRTPETTHTIAGEHQCKVCRRKRWRDGYAVAIRNRAYARTIAAQRAAARRAFALRQIELAEMNAEERAASIRTEKIAGRLSLQGLISAAAFFFDVTPEGIMSSRRHGPLTHARSVVYQVLRDRGHSYPMIGRVMGGKDHSTVLNSLRNWEKYRAKDPRIDAAYNAIRDEVHHA